MNKDKKQKLTTCNLNKTALALLMLLSTGITLSASVNASTDEHQEASHDAHSHQQPKTKLKSVNGEQRNKVDEETSKELHASNESEHQHGEDDHNDENSVDEEEGSHEQGITFSLAKMAIADIAVSTITPKRFAKTLYAPGEIKANGYKSYIVSPRTESVVIARHVTLGQHVDKGEALVTLFSESVAQAQAQYRVAYNDWLRNKKLGRDTVSDSQLLNSETDYIAAYSRLQAYGLTKAAIAKVVENNSSNLGEYTLIAQREGAVLNDDFSQGQRVSAGERIITLANESELWVEARVSPNKRLNLPIGTKAVIEMAGESFTATIIQEAHTIDPLTRTRIVRLSVKNTQDSLHPGMFVNVNFLFSTQKKVMAVPEAALMRSSDGDWTVFVEDHPGEFAALEVELGQSLGAYREVIGLKPNTKVVTQGAFFVASEIAKGGFDPHNH